MRFFLILVIAIIAGNAAIRYRREHANSPATGSYSNPAYRDRSTEELRAELGAKEALLVKYKDVVVYHKIGAPSCVKPTNIQVTVSAETQQQMAQFELDVRALRAELASR